MSKKNVLLKSEEVIARNDVAAFLRQVADALEQGQVSLKQDEEVIQLEVPGQIEFEVQVDEKPKKVGKQVSLEFELEWLVGEDGKPMSGGVSIE